MKRLLNEPLIHFLVLGAAFFGMYSYVSEDILPAGQAIVVTQGRIDSLITAFTRTWQRPPTDTELKGLIDDYVREEVCSREALALGLDRDDTIIRRRLRQKLEFVTEDLVANAEPTDGELQDYLASHPEHFRIDRNYTFKHVYFNADRRGESVLADAAQMLAELNAAGAHADHASFGDATMLERTFEGVTANDVQMQFGPTFAEALWELPIGQWQGPIESGYGLHLVLVNKRSEGRLPSLDEVHDDVRRRWADARRADASKKFYESLLKRYPVVIEPFVAASTNDQTASAR